MDPKKGMRMARKVRRTTVRERNHRRSTRPCQGNKRHTGGKGGRCTGRHLLSAQHSLAAQALAAAAASVTGTQATRLGSAARTRFQRGLRGQASIIASKYWKVGWMQIWAGGGGGGSGARICAYQRYAKGAGQSFLWKLLPSQARGLVMVRACSSDKAPPGMRAPGGPPPWRWPG